MTVSLSRRAFVVILALIFSACGGSPTTPTVPDPGSQPAGPGNIAERLTVNITPGENAELRTGDTISVSVSAPQYSDGTVYHAVVFQRDDEREMLFGCSSSTSGTASATIPSSDSFWKGGHTFNAVAVVHFTAAPQVQGYFPCPFLTGSAIDWAKVTYKKEVHLGWRVNGQ
jgi:hypothetical protein